ncbi:ATP-binding cassette domain-containing protein [Streptomyces triticagri]|uniref:ATP-binding cassette domain-containing protein n=1 Tax=Streptomyces triticagri TaxID=2293568 RepID=UPI0013140022|nr:ABC transporter ATP-binding protein [Streptomyces triticagri]
MKISEGCRRADERHERLPAEVVAFTAPGWCRCLALDSSGSAVVWQDGSALLSALDAVSLRQDVLRLPEGQDTVVGRAAPPSGGQRQRLELARALLTDADVVLLYEPTSQLDSIDEQRLRDIIDDVAESRSWLWWRTGFLRVQHADHVILMEAGHVIGSGIYSELLECCAPYADLVRSQQRSAEAPVQTAKALSEVPAQLRTGASSFLRGRGCMEERCAEPSGVVRRRPRGGRR